MECLGRGTADAYRLIRQDEFVNTGVVAGGARLYRRGLECFGFGHAVGVEGRFVHRAAAGPEAMADDLARIGIAHPVRAFTRRRGSPRKARDRQVEAAPEELHRAALADEGTAAVSEHLLDLEQDAPEALRLFAVIAGVHGIILKSDRILDLHRHRADLHWQPHGQQRCGELAVEIRHASRFECQRPLIPIVGAQVETMRNEVEFHAQEAGPVRQTRGRQTARRQMQRHPPGMVDWRRQRHGNLAHHLRPHVQRRVGIAPLIERQCRPGLVACRGHRIPPAAIIRCR
jgi:hypothetical protein